MSRPTLLLLQLLVVGLALGGGIWWLTEKKDSSSAKSTADPELALPQQGSGGNPSGEGPGSVEILQDQVEYLQGQVGLLQEENENLILYINKLEAEQGANNQPAQAAIDPEELAKRVSEIRKLPFTVTPQLTPLSAEEMQARHKVDLGGEQSVTPYRQRGRAWAALGLIPPDTNTLQGTLAVRAEAEGAFLPTSDSETLFVYQDDPLTTHNRGTRIMDLGNMLQEQHLNPPQPWSEQDATLDQQIAALALRRGDAALIRFQYELAESLAGKPAPSNDGRDEGSGRPAHGVPFSLREAYLIFPLLAGGEFVKELYDEGGWETVNAAHRNPPKTTAEIFHPELYLTGGFTPTQPEWKEVTVLGSTPIWDGVAGELGCLLVLKQQLPESTALQAAEGWRGDRHLLYSGTDDDPSTGDHLVWETHWADAGNAGDFFHALRKSLLNRYELPFPEGENTGENGTPFVTSTPDGQRHLHLSQPTPTQVRLLDTGSVDWLTALRQHFPSP